MDRTLASILIENLFTISIRSKLLIFEKLINKVYTVNYHYKSLLNTVH